MSVKIILDFNDEMVDLDMQINDFIVVNVDDFCFQIFYQM